MYNTRLYMCLKEKKISKVFKLLELIKNVRCNLLDKAVELEFNSEEYKNTSRILKEDYDKDNQLERVLKLIMSS